MFFEDTGRTHHDCKLCLCTVYIHMCMYIHMYSHYTRAYLNGVPSHKHIIYDIQRSPHWWKVGCVGEGHNCARARIHKLTSHLFDSCDAFSSSSAWRQEFMTTTGHFNVVFSSHLVICVFLLHWESRVFGPRDWARELYLGHRSRVCGWRFCDKR